MPHPWLTGTIREDEDRKRSEAPRAEDKKVYPRSFAGMIGLLGHMPRQLPYEKMRQSTNVIDRSRAQPPPPSLADLVAGQFVPNAEYRERMLMPGDPADPLPAAAGLNDIVRFVRRR